MASKAKDSEGLGLLMDGVRSLVESLPPLVRALDVVAQIHPFLSIVVGAFKVVVELEVKRREKNKKINLLFLEMRNMMTVLLHTRIRVDTSGHAGHQRGRCNGSGVQPTHAGPVSEKKDQLERRRQAAP
ncbi:hypothetical protein C2E23DRAFT_563837 [Lenzites betulinus]|nr:hypothetical protein C2E23DRAFT_563837 [Lenzites betulinus]